VLFGSRDGESKGLKKSSAMAQQQEESVFYALKREMSGEFKFWILLAKKTFF